MSRYTYEIKKSVDLFRKLLDEREDCLHSPTSSRHAMNFVVTAWHLCEWIYEEYRTHPAVSRFRNIHDFRTYLRSQGDFESLGDLANGAKHFSLSKNTPSVLATRKVDKGEVLGFRITKEPGLAIVRRIEHIAVTEIAFSDFMYFITLFWLQFFQDKLGEDMVEIIIGYTAIRNSIMD